MLVPAGVAEGEFTVTGLSPGFVHIAATLNGNSITRELTVHER